MNQTIDESQAWMLSLLAEAGGEFDLEKIEREGVLEGPGAELLLRYLELDRRFLEKFARGVEPGSFVLVERDLLRATQSTSGALGKKDLVQEYAALGEVAELDEVLEELLSSHLCAEDIERPGVEVLEHDSEHTVVEVLCEGRRAWPKELGGSGAEGEIERRFMLCVRRAPWRDRAVRRLQSLSVISVELHADPSSLLS